jgi:mannitol-1-/sugar-/sorbitol-6-/2-deoxyglucose-6-phosphatase
VSARNWAFSLSELGFDVGKAGYRARVAYVQPATVFGLNPDIPLQAALFDLDGLLVDSEPLWHDAEVKVLRGHGVPLTPEMCRQTKGRYVREAVVHWHDRYPWETPAIDEVVAEILDELATLVSTRLELKAGALEAVAACRDRSLRLAVASSSPLQIIETAIARFHLSDVFEAVCSAEHEPAGKPNPAVFLTAARLLASRPDRCVVLEDSPAGIRAAKAAGMLCIAVPEERDPSDRGERAAHADVVLNSLEELDESVWRRLEIPSGSEVTVVLSHAGPDRSPIRLEPGETFSVGQRDDEWPAFVFVTKSSGEGWVPKRILEQTADDGRYTLRPGFSYDTTELDADPGDVLQVVETDLSSGWLWCENSSGITGWIPSRCVEPVG